LPNGTLKSVVIHVLSKLQNKIALLTKERELIADVESDVAYIIALVVVSSYQMKNNQYCITQW
jgi:hypothetical protein